MTEPTKAPRDEPTVFSTLMELEEASFRRGQAVARGDDVSAREHYRQALDAIGRILVMTGQAPAKAAPASKPVLDAAESQP
jgi:hypothetical protein